ncbi:hypothetical protein IID24_05625 [Patescibacteria group bacterium]|nr:hypothetical protein [Patescibacteria group bacterium]
MIEVRYKLSYKKGLREQRVSAGSPRGSHCDHCSSEPGEVTIRRCDAFRADFKKPIVDFDEDGLITKPRPQINDSVV